ncbi:MAG: ADP-glyceromanno-heptose 6-epimerase [Candidatus Omnitrophica bacterium]|nr:ADP-glyceromanno-heptose 6-epimerase [Candidatus Omnitrophota bacterium]MDE2231050.1 ADP-glyceromanno-heptose 6-epimerase [Candidatus Omnitrophota bacterium]
MIVVTGAAGFIGSCLVARLNSLGRHDLIVVDEMSGDGDPKKKNLAGKRYQRYYDKAEYLKLLKRDSFDFDVECILHMGACSSTTLDDADYFRKNNFEYSCSVAQWAAANDARLIYASSAATYGNGEMGYSDEESMVPRLKPLNLYGESKQKFDEWVLQQGYQNRMAGLKFFNVFGPNEYHKGDMRSVVSKAYGRVVSEGKMVLFKSYRPEYKDGGQKRDFIYVKDAVEAVLFFMENPGANGIFNLGTGRAHTFNELAHALFAAVGRTPAIEYIEMPENLRDRYQYFTQADMAKLRRAGYTRAFMPLQDAVKDYCGYLSTGSCW